MTDPAGGAPNPQAPAPPPAGPPPGGPPAGDSWQAPPPPTPTTSSFQAPASFQPVAAEAGPAPGILYADLMTRIIAYIIDAILIGILSAFISIALGALIFGFLLNGGMLLTIIATVLLSAATLFLSAVYFVWGWTNPTMRASLGQKALGLETVNAADGATLTRDQAIRRWGWLFGPYVLASVFQLVLAPTSLALLSSLLSLLTLGYTIYLLWTASQSPKRQGYHDVQAATVVVKRVA